MKNPSHHLVGLEDLGLHRLGHLMYSVVHVAHVVLLDGTEGLALHGIEDARVLVSAQSSP